MGEREGEQTSLKDGKRRRSHEREGDPIRAGDPTRDQRKYRFSEGEGDEER